MYIFNNRIVTQIFFCLSLSQSYAQTNIGSCHNREFLNDSAYFISEKSPVVSYFLDGSGIEYFKNDTLEISWYFSGACKSIRYYKYGQTSITKSWWENGLTQCVYKTNELWRDKMIYGSDEKRVIFFAKENGTLMVLDGNGYFDLWGEKGKFKDTLKTGLWSHEFNDGTIIKAMYVNGLKHGIYERWNGEKKLIFRCYFRYGKPHGYWQSWYSNGQKHEKGKVKNELFSILKLWTPYGKKIIKRGNGVYYFYQDNGTPNPYSRPIEYRNGKGVR